MSSSLSHGEVEISCDSDICYLDLIQEVSDKVGQLAGFDADTLYWIGLSLRESVTNAIQHGNKQDKSKKVEIRFQINSRRLVISVTDQGNGLSESQIPDPLNPENLLKAGGRGIFFVRSFMDKVTFDQNPGGGFTVRMEKRVNHKTKGEDNDD